MRQLNFLLFAGGKPQFSQVSPFPSPSPLPSCITHTDTNFVTLTRRAHILFSLATKHYYWRKLVSCAWSIPELLRICISTFAPFMTKSICMHSLWLFCWHKSLSCPNSALSSCKHALPSHCRLGCCWCIVALEETLKHVDTATVCAFIMSHMIKKDSQNWLSLLVRL